ncbi:glycerophosphodiester phosphodiesterase family protein [Pseudoalteromonas aurantia]|uniref:glycerophosphodiester phosphodiesterase n=1 Tax=Pseudoalteromonas aurantia TaxID=43654 RepID=A0A5S3V8D7_9GAMM|nr:glycerophosphodiester phosphodiesterase family protein [Pseudoalteromonas aurantia]TMO61342.1 glycerophosphodiester phosphodiesterase [Pseudoalteromonas aurantia]TMO68133.1 glycerophosphodiester phosphodiesterase [Pseudoalteromonas aurantia]TMO72267.1 glycerophosphodiester phosphodiesterase [Pseudoalteromonas aurantia]
MNTKCFLILGTLLINGCASDSDLIKDLPATPYNKHSDLTTEPVPLLNTVQVGTRPQFLVNQLDEGALKNKLAACQNGPFYKTDFSIGHRGAPMQYPEHTKESYVAAAKMGAGILECDVTFTKDKALVCRHSQCDLHTTTNILSIPELANKCSEPFTPADPAQQVAASAKCCTSDITLAEFKQLSGKMDSANPQATNVIDYQNGTANWRTDLYASQGTLLTHKESIALFESLNVKMTPELKSASVQMPFDGMSQAMYAQKMLDEYEEMGIAPAKVFPQSFNLADVRYWLDNAPLFATQAVYLDGRYNMPGFNPLNEKTWQPSMAQLVDDGVKIIAPPLWVLVTLDAQNQIVPSQYAIAAKQAGLKIITWTLERSAPLASGGGWYYHSITDAINSDDDALVLLDVLAQQVGVMGVFSDWPATTTYYASCMEMQRVN